MIVLLITFLQSHTNNVHVQLYNCIIDYKYYLLVIVLSKMV